MFYVLVLLPVVAFLSRQAGRAVFGEEFLNALLQGWRRARGQHVLWRRQAGQSFENVGNSLKVRLGGVQLPKTEFQNSRQVIRDRAKAGGEVVRQRQCDLHGRLRERATRKFILHGSFLEIPFF